MSAKQVGKLIREARTKAGLTQEQLAKKIKGLSASDLSKAERGEKELTQDQLKAIAKATGVTQKSLLDAAKGGSSSSSSSSSSSASKTLKLSAAEKKLVELYRKADTETRKAAIDLLTNGTSSGGGLLSGLTGNSGSGSGSDSNSGGLLGSIINGLFGTREMPEDGEKDN